MKKLLLALILFAATSPAQTTVSDKFPVGVGNLPWYSSLLISWPAYQTFTGQTVAAGQKTVNVAADGSFTVQLPPGDTALPPFQYTVQYQLKSGITGATVQWLVPTTSASLSLTQVQWIQGAPKTSLMLTQVRCPTCKNGDVPTFNGSQFQPVSVSAFEPAGSATAVLTTSAQKSANLADLANPAAALTNLGGITASQAAAAAPVQSVAGRSGSVTISTVDVAGLGSAATHATTDFDAAGLASTAQSNAMAASLQKTANLADLSNPSKALANLGGITASQAAAAAPVQSVAGRSGNITISTVDVTGLGSAATHASTDFDAAGLASAAQSNAVAVSLQKTANLADLSNPSKALANLGGITASQAAAAAPVQSVAGRSGSVTISTVDVAGLGSAATHATTDFDAAGLALTAQSNAIAVSLQKTANLADLSSPSTALANLGGVTAAQASAAAPVQKVAGISPSAGNVALASTNLADSAILLRANATGIQALQGPVTVPQINNIFYVDGYPATGCTAGGVAYRTQLDCAFYTAASYVVATNQSSTLRLGSATYTTCAGLTLPTVPLNATLSLEGNAQSIWYKSPQTRIQQTCALSSAVVYQPNRVGSLQNSLHITGISVDANNLSPSCFDLFGVKQSNFEHLSCANTAAGDHMMAISNPDGSAGGISFEVFLRDITVEGAGHNESLPATVTANVVGGQVTSYTVTNGGIYPTNSNLTVYFYGTAAGAVPCATMPTASAVLTGTQITAINPVSVGAGCTGSIYVQVHVTPIANYGIIMKTLSDSTAYDLRPIGNFNTAALSVQYGSNTFIHTHPYAHSQIEIQDYGHNHWSGTEIDKPAQYGFDLEGPSSILEGTDLFYGGEPLYGSTAFYLSAAATGTKFLGIKCGQIGLSGWHEFMTPSGPVDTGQGAFPAASNQFIEVSGNGTCDSSVPPLNFLNEPIGSSLRLAPLNAATPARNYMPGSLYLDASVYNGTAAQTNTWVINHSTNTSGNATFDALQFVEPRMGNSSLPVVQFSAPASAPATASANTEPPRLQTQGSYWTGSASANDTWTWAPQMGVGANPTSTLLFSHTGSAGVASVQVPALQLIPYQVQPTCSSSTRGLLWTVQGGSGVQDHTYQCIKNASDAYVWQQIF